MTFWPILMAAVSLGVNVDWVVIPFLRIRGLSVSRILIIAIFMGMAEALYWYWFTGWLGKVIADSKPIKESINLGKQLGGDLKNDTYLKRKYLEKITNHFVKQYEWAINPDNWLVKMIKYGGYLAVVVLGFFIPGGRLGGVIFCRITKWRTGFLVLMVTDLGHLFYVVLGWNWLFSFFGL